MYEIPEHLPPLSTSLNERRKIIVEKTWRGGLGTGDTATRALQEGHFIGRMEVAELLEYLREIIGKFEPIILGQFTMDKYLALKELMQVIALDTAVRMDASGFYDADREPTPTALQLIDHLARRK